MCRNWRDPPEKMKTQKNRQDEEDPKTASQETEFARTVHARLRQISSRHDEIQENLDRTAEITGKKGSLESTEKKTKGREQEIEIPRDAV